MTHGLGGNRKNWRGFARQLSLACPKFQFALIDLRGHGAYCVLDFKLSRSMCTFG